MEKQEIGKMSESDLFRMAILKYFDAAIIIPARKNILKRLFNLKSVMLGLVNNNFHGKFEGVENF